MPCIRIVDRPLDEAETDLLRAELAAAGLFPHVLDEEGPETTWGATVEDRYDGESCP